MEKGHTHRGCCLFPAGSDSIAKATNQASSAVLTEASPPPDADPHAKAEPASDPTDSADQSAASASLSPEQNATQHGQQQQSPQQQQTGAAAQWVETDDLGVSKRQVATITKHAMPNGVLPQSHGSMQGGSQQPQGNSQQPPADSQQPHGRMQQPEGGVHGAESGSDMAEVKAEGLPLGAEQAGPSEQPDVLVKHELPDADQVHSTPTVCAIATKESRIGCHGASRFAV